jgi:hypothetical protein
VQAVCVAVPHAPVLSQTEAIWKPLLQVLEQADPGTQEPPHAPPTAPTVPTQAYVHEVGLPH